MALIGLRGDDPTSIGAGFLVRVASRLYVITAAHVAPDSRDFHELFRWAPQFSICPDSDGSVGRYDLFEQGTPKFRYHLDGEGRMLDMVAFEVPERRWPTRIYDLGGDCDLKSNDRLSAYGFPDRGNKKRPYWPPDKIQGHFVREEDPHAYTTLPTRKGHSGGPVLRKGTLAGMIVGSDEGFGTIIPLKVLRRLF